MTDDERAARDPKDRAGAGHGDAPDEGERAWGGDIDLFRRLSEDPSANLPADGERALAGRRWSRTGSATNETAVHVLLDLDGPPGVDANTGVPFFDHMLDQLGFHAGWLLHVSCDGDAEVDDHHTVEDVGLALGAATAEAAGKGGANARRFGAAHAPLDEALARAVVDASGRPFFAGDLGLRRERVGALSCEMVPHFFRSFAQNARMSVHVDVLRGDNDHHRVEAAFKAFALAIKEALTPTDSTGVPSTKGVL